MTQPSNTDAVAQAASATATAQPPPASPAAAQASPTKAAESPPPKACWLRFLKPSECRDWAVPKNHLLIGDQHLVRGNVMVIGGPPGVGKSRASVMLALSGASGRDWFGLNVHTRFKTAILQAENGRYRLKQDFGAIAADDLDDWVRVSEPPPLGMAFDKKEFVDELVAWLKSFKPDVVVLDPWNSMVDDDKQKDYREAFRRILDAIRQTELEVAVVIVAHTRKPRHDEKPQGRDLLPQLSGSLVLGSVPRSAFVMQPATSDPSDQRVKWTCCKNNDGEMGKPSVWRRGNGAFEKCTGADAVVQAGASRPTVTTADLEAAFEGGAAELSRTDAVEKLKARTGLSQSACYAALKTDGKFASHLKSENGILTWNSSLGTQERERSTPLIADGSRKTAEPPDLATAAKSSGPDDLSTARCQSGLLERT